MFSVLRDSHTSLERDVCLRGRSTPRPQRDELHDGSKCVGAHLTAIWRTSFSAVSTCNCPIHKDMMWALQPSGAGMTRILDSSCIAQALTGKLPPSAQFRMDPGDLVRVFRETLPNGRGRTRCIASNGSKCGPSEQGAGEALFYGSTAVC